MLLDTEGMSVKDNFDLEKFKYFYSLIGNMFPDIVNQLIVGNLGIFLRAIYSIGSKFVHPNTLKKVFTINCHRSNKSVVNKQYITI